MSFTWSSVNGSGSYGLYVGSSRGAGDYYRREEFGTRATVTGLPTDGRLLYVSLWSRVEGGWKAREYVMRAASQ